MEVGEKLALYSILVVASHLGLETYQEWVCPATSLVLWSSCVLM
jgi:hypothetical protein